MEIGIDSFASAMYGTNSLTSADAMEQLLERIAFADEVGFNVFGIGEHHKKEFLDSATAVILATAAARTKRIRLTSAVTVLSAADPVRVYQSFATLDLISKGRSGGTGGWPWFISRSVSLVWV
ncbi:LLM class flavin-dependent oxidoreductase [Spirosoma jeollabukense]